MAIKRTVTLNFKTNDGKVLPAAFEVSDGESAFDTWKKLPGNATKTESQFIAEQKGAKGDKGLTGDRGPQGEKGANGTNGTNGAQGTKGDAGAQGASIISVEVVVKENA